jgi:hypothetical protein
MTRSRDLDACAAAPSARGDVQAPGSRGQATKEGNDCTHVHRDRSAARGQPDPRHSARDSAAIMTSARAEHLPENGQLAEVNPPSDIGQRWWHGRHSWVRRSDGGFNRSRYDVEPISDPVAKSYVERMHYSGSYVSLLNVRDDAVHAGDGHA